MDPIHVGVISDTHGLLRPQAVDALRGSSLIIHAGDVGDASILDELGQIAPVVAVRGNVDTAPWALSLPDTQVVEIGAILAYILHDRGELDLDPAAAGFRIVIFGHSHQPLIEERQGVLYLNPGSAGPRRFRLPVSVARLQIVGQKIDVEIVELQ